MVKGAQALWVAFVMYLSQIALKVEIVDFQN